MSLLTQFYNSSGGGGATSVTAGGFNSANAQSQIVATTKGLPGVFPTLVFSNVTSSWFDTYNNPDIAVVHGVDNPPNYNQFILNITRGIAATAANLSTNATELTFINATLVSDSGYSWTFTGSNLVKITGSTFTGSGGFSFVNLPATFTTWENSSFAFNWDPSGGGMGIIGANFANFETCKFTWSNGTGTNRPGIAAGNKLTVASVTKIISDAYDVELTNPTGVGQIDLARGTNAGLSSLSAATQAKVSALTAGGWLVQLNP